MAGPGDSRAQSGKTLPSEAAGAAVATGPLRESEQRFRAVFEQAPVGIVLLTPEAEVTRVNKRFCQMLGYSTAELLALDDVVAKITHPDDLATDSAHLQELVAGQRDSYEIEKRYVRKDGQLVWARLTLSALRDPAGALQQLLGIVDDIGERRHAQQAQQRSFDQVQAERALLTQVIEQIPAGVMIIEAPSGRELFRNTQVEAITGLRASDAVRPLDRPDFRAFYPDGRPYAREQWPLARALCEGEIVIDEEMAHFLPDGERRTMSASAAPVRDGSGRIVAAVATFHDITARRRAETNARFLAEASETLASSLDYEAMLRAVAKLAVPRLADWCTLHMRDDANGLRPLAVVHRDAATQAHLTWMLRRYPVRLDGNRCVAAALRTGEPEWVPEVDELFLKQVAQDKAHLHELRALGMRSLMSVPMRARGRLEGAITFVSDASGRRYSRDDLSLAEELAHLTGLAVDNARLYRDAQRELAERDRAERKLAELNRTLEQRVAERTAEAEQRAAQLRALATQLTQAEQRERRRLAQTLHDHLQQLLVGVKMQLGMLETLSAQDVPHAVAEASTLLNEAIESSRTLSHELSPPVLYDAGLGAALHWLVPRMRSKYGLVIDVHAAEDAEPEDEAVKVFLFQAVSELLLNVVKHAHTHAARVTMQPAGEEVCVTVTDQGAGFDPEAVNEDREAEHFGLFGIRERFEAMGGRVRIDSAAGLGTSIALHAPRHAQDRGEVDAAPQQHDHGRHHPSEAPAAPSAQPQSKPADDGHRHIRVLLVDDHEVVRSGLRTMLEQQSDIRIIAEADDGEPAVELAETHRPDVVVMDVTMPRLNGIEATRRIKERMPEARVIGLSMHEREAMAEAMLAAGAVAYLPKGGPADDLIEAIREGAEHKRA
ncbi:MAG: PAS domain S-box protein [Phycisphaeraceae bacterium]